MSSHKPATWKAAASRTESVIALFAIAAILLRLVMRFGGGTASTYHGLPLYDLPLIGILFCGGIPLVLGLLLKIIRLEFGSDLLAGISIVTAALLGEYLAGSLVVLMLSGGQALEAYAVRSASSVLDALARRMPTLAHCKHDGQMTDVSLAHVAAGDTLTIFPHEICPVDGTLLEGRGVMDESYLTGEPYMMSKAPGSQVLSGAINGDNALTIRADRLAVDSRYAKIMQVMRESEQRHPRLRRLGDKLGAFYTPLAVGIALAAWGITGQPVRFLAVLVIATPCPLLIAIPVAIIGSVSLAARRGIIIKDPAVLENIDGCRTAIFDKTGTLTYGTPKLTKVFVDDGFTEREVLGLVASLERYSRHPLAGAVLEAASSQQVALNDASQISERPGEGLQGTIAGRTIEVTSHKQLAVRKIPTKGAPSTTDGGLQCAILIDDRYAATFRFRDEPRREGASFVRHLRPKHRFTQVILVSGDRESEVQYLADRVGIEQVYSNQSPEQKVGIVRSETQRASTLFLGDGINDAPALAVATVGIAFGHANDITTEAAGAVVMESSLERVDELFHISRRMRSIAMESALGGMALSLAGMLVAAAGYLPPVSGAIVQEIIDVLAVVNALRAAVPPKALTDYKE